MNLLGKRNAKFWKVTCNQIIFTCLYRFLQNILFLKLLDISKEKSAIHIARTYLGQRKNYSGMSFWAHGYFVYTVGAAEEVVRVYIRAQEKEDHRVEQLSLFKDR